MAREQRTGWGEYSLARIGPSPEIKRVYGGGLADSTQDRLKALRRWKGFTSFMSPSALAVAGDMRVTPMAQVVGGSTGVLQYGVLRTTEPGQGRARIGKARWREHTGHIRSWDIVRRRALDRLKQQAELLGANAVVAVKPRRTEPEWAEGHVIEYAFTGTAVRVDGLRRRRDAPPFVTLASAQELWRLLQAGVEPVGVAGSFASVQTTVSFSSQRLDLSWSSPNAEYEDLTKSVYEAWRLALERLRADARGLGAAGLIGIDMTHSHRSGERLPAEITVHLLATALRKRAESGLRPQPVVGVGVG